MLMGDLLQRTGQTDKLMEFLNQGIDVFTQGGNPDATAQLLSFLNVVLANQGDLEGAAAANLKTLELLPNNAAAMRNLAIIRRDQGNLDEALDWANKALAATDPGAVAELKTVHQLLGELYQRQGRTDLLIEQYEQIRQLDPADAAALQTLSSLYGCGAERRQAAGGEPGAGAARTPELSVSSGHRPGAAAPGAHAGGLDLRPAGAGTGA